MGEWVIDKENEEIWLNSDIYRSRKEAIEAGRKELGDGFYIGKAVRFVPRIDAEYIIERLQMEAYDEVGEVSDGWLDFRYGNAEVEDLQKRLQAAFDEWLESVKQKPGFYAVRETEWIGGDA